jgi:hypothetical protein
MLTTICFQFSMLNIYNPYGCHLKDQAIIPLICTSELTRLYNIWREQHSQQNNIQKEMMERKSFQNITAI